MIDSIYTSQGAIYTILIESANVGSPPCGFASSVHM